MYREILSEYKTLTDNNPALAYNIMQKATAYKDTVGEQLADYDKMQIDLKHTAEAIKCQLSSEYAPTKPTEGNRYACYQKEYLDAIQNYTNAKKMFEYTEIQYKILSDICYQAYAIYMKGECEYGKKTNSKM